MPKSFCRPIIIAMALGFAGPSLAQTTLFEMETGKTITTHVETVSSPIDYTVFDEMIKKLTVEQGGRPRIAYDFIREQKLNFMENYISYLERQDVTALSKNDQMAYWLNLQNIVVVQAILDEGKKKSLKKLRGTAEAPGPLWVKPRVTVAGQDLSLQDIETKLFTTFDNPNIIYGLYQGVRGGPALTSKAYRGAIVSEMLDNNAKQYVNAKGIVGVKKNIIEVPPIFLWYQDVAFGGDSLALTEHLKSYAEPTLKSALYRGKTIEAKSLNYRLDSYKISTDSSTSSSGSRGGYGS